MFGIGFASEKECNEWHQALTESEQKPKETTSTVIKVETDKIRFESKERDDGDDDEESNAHF